MVYAYQGFCLRGEDSNDSSVENRISSFRQLSRFLEDRGYCILAEDRHEVGDIPSQFKLGKDFPSRDSVSNLDPLTFIAPVSVGVWLVRPIASLNYVSDGAIRSS